MFRNLWLYDFKQTADDYCVLSFPLWFRLVLVGLILFVLYAVNLWIRDMISLAWAFTVFMGLAAITDDRWVFNKHAGSMTRISGVLVFAKRWAIAFEEIEAVCIASDIRSLIQEGDPFSKTMLFEKPGTSGYALRLYDGKNVIVSHLPQKRKDQLFAQASRLAAFIGKPIIEEKTEA